MNVVIAFDYSSVPADKVESIRDASTRIKLRMSRTAQDIIEIGRDLIAVKKQLGHGNFLPWIKAEFGMSNGLACNFMQAAENLGGKFITDMNLPPSVIYALAAPSTSDEVRADVIGRVERGEKVSVADVKALKDTLAEKDESIRKLKSLKNSADAHVERLVEEVSAKTSLFAGATDELQHLKEEVRRLTEPNTITVTAHKVDGFDLFASAQAPYTKVVSDLEPLKIVVRQIWSALPAEMHEWWRAEYAIPKDV